MADKGHLSKDQTFIAVVLMLALIFVPIASAHAIAMAWQ